jgi:amino acid transporter
VSRLRLFSIAALGVNTIVGSGIFELPAELARAMGGASFAATITTWSTTCAAVPAQLAAIVPGADAHPRLVATACVIVMGSRTSRAC